MTIGGKKISLTTQIFVAMIIGSIAGLICGDIIKQVAFIGTIWLNCVKMIVVPMVFFTIITGITSQKNLSSLGRIETSAGFPVDADVPQRLRVVL